MSVDISNAFQVASGLHLSPSLKHDSGSHTPGRTLTSSNAEAKFIACSRSFLTNSNMMYRFVAKCCIDLSRFHNRDKSRPLRQGMGTQQHGNAQVREIMPQNSVSNAFSGPLLVHL